MGLRQFLCVGFIFLAGTALVACDSTETKYDKYISRGNSYYQDHDYIKARLEYKNAARIMPDDPRAIYSLGLVEEAEGNLRSALSAFLTAEQQAPSFKPVLLKLAGFYLTAQQPGEASTRVDKLLELEPNHAAAHAIRGSLFLRAKAFDKARREVDISLKNDPSNVIAHSVLAGLYLAQDQKDKALETLDKALASTPEELSFHLLKAAIHSERDDTDAVIQDYHRIFELRPDEIRFRFDLARILSEAGQSEDAKKTYQDTVLAFPGNAEAKHRLAAFLENKKGMAAAEDQINGFIRSTPGEKVFYLWLADLYARHDQNDRAIATLENVLNASPDDWIGLNASTALAQIQLGKGDVELAERLLDSVLEKDVNNKEALFLQANLAFILGDYQKAVADLRTLLSANPGARKASRLLAEIFLVQERLDLAIDTLLQALQEHPDDKGGLVRLAQLYALSGNHDKALEILSGVTEEDPAYPTGWETLARLTIETRQWDKAADAAERLAALPDQTMTAVFLRGQIAQRKGDVQQAITLYKQVIAADPSAPLAAYTLSAFLEAVRGDESKLTDLRDFLVSLETTDPTVQAVLGGIEVRLGHPDAAETAFRTAISQKPHNQAPYVALAEILAGRADTDQALDILQKAETALPSETRASMMHADLLTRSNQIDEAIALYETILARKNGADSAANNLAQLIADFRSGDKTAMERARLLAERFINSENPYYLDTLGWVYVRMDLIPQAQPVLARAVSLLKKPHPQIDYHYGTLLYAAGQEDEAKIYLRRAVSGNAQYPGVKDARALLEKLG